LGHVEISQTTMSLAMLLVYWWKALVEFSRGAPSWFHNVPTYGGEIIEYWTILSLKFCLNQKQKNIGEFEHAIDILLLESPRWVGFKEAKFEKK
jgi:hypothetical protein